MDDSYIMQLSTYPVISRVLADYIGPRCLYVYVGMATTASTLPPNEPVLKND